MDHKEFSRKGGKVKSEAKTLAARKNAKNKRGIWVTAFYYGVTGKDGKLHMGMYLLRGKFDMELDTNYEKIGDMITEGLQWCKDEALPWKEIVYFEGQSRRMI